MGLPEGSEDLSEVSVGLSEGSEGLPEGPEGLPEGLEGLPEGPEGLSEGPEGLPEGPGGGGGERMYGRTDGVSPHSTGFSPLSGPLPKNAFSKRDTQETKITLFHADT